MEKNMHETLDSFRTEWNKMTFSGFYDSIISISKPYLMKSMEKRDTLSVVYSAIAIAQSYLQKEQNDSVSAYLDILAGYESNISEPKLGILLNNIKGVYAMKNYLDYAKALEYYNNAYAWASSSKDINNQIVLLTNIVNIFYARSDKSGIQYASKAIDLCQDTSATEYHKSMAAISMAQMYILSNDYQNALSYLKIAEKGDNINGLRSQINLLRGDIYTKTKELDEAEKFIAKAEDYSKFAEPGTCVQIHLKRGDLYDMKGDIPHSIDEYKKGLEISYRHKNVEFRQDILKKITDQHYRSGERDTALYYFKIYHSHLDSIANKQREREFNNRLLYYKQIEYDHSLQAKELALLKARRKTQTTALILIIFILTSTSLYYLYYKQNKNYKQLVMRHQNYLKQFQLYELRYTQATATKQEDTAKKGDVPLELFQQIEQLMDEQCLYRSNNLTIVKLAEMLNTNRTYVSKAINNFAGMSFNNYLDTWRIREAGKIISEDDEIPFKQLADDLGYNSISVFYKAFQHETGCTPGRYRQNIRKLKKENIENS